MLSDCENKTTFFYYEPFKFAKFSLWYLLNPFQRYQSIYNPLFQIHWDKLIICQFYLKYSVEIMFNLINLIDICKYVIILYLIPPTHLNQVGTGETNDWEKRGMLNNGSVGDIPHINRLIGNRWEYDERI